uniref:Uncharacterized protein n=1 Tax=Kalanchoe fedtschenkoi TaxID=63787 RepID=A0A7N0TZX9_KALFE
MQTPNVIWPKKHSGIFALSHSKRCLLQSAVELVGKQVHSLGRSCGFDLNNYVMGSLIDFHAKSGDVDSLGKQVHYLG